MPSPHSIEWVMGRLAKDLDDLYAIPVYAHATYRSYALEHLIEHSPRTAANCIYDHMVAEAERRFQDREDIRPITIRGLKLWVFGDHSVIRWKKMDDDGSSRNYPTEQEYNFDAMQPLDGLAPEPTRVCVGYVLDPTGLEIKRVQIARPNIKRVDWCAALIPIEQRKEIGGAWQEVTKQIRAEV